MINQQTPKCGCGRSESGYCDGSHALTNEQYAAKVVANKNLQENKKFLVENTK